MSAISSRAAPWALGIFTALHGIAHFAGTAGHLERIDDGTSEEYLGGAWTIGEPSILRALAVVWAVLGVAYLAVSLLVVVRRPAAQGAFVGVTLLSLALTIVALWAAVIGVIVNLVLLALVWRSSHRLFPATA